MFKKISAIAVWLILLSVLFTFCLFIALAINGTLLTAFICWASILFGLIFLRLVFVGIDKLIRSGRPRAWLNRFKLSRREAVLFGHWKSGQRILSRLRWRKARIPWYLLVGADSGKSTLLARAGLTAYAKNHTLSVTPSRSVRWWFFRHTAFLEVATPILNQPSEWGKAWLRVVKWCRRLYRPAGVVVCLSVESLQMNNNARLHQQARQLRALLEPLFKSTGLRLPVQIVITGCDKLPGMAQWIEQLSPEQRSQPLGWQWAAPPIIDSAHADWLTPVFNQLQEGMGYARLSMLNASRPDSETVQLLDVPDVIARLQSELHTWLSALFEADAYSIPGSIQGVWLTGIRESGDGDERISEGVFSHDLLNLHLANPKPTDEIPAFSSVRRCWRAALLAVACCGVVVGLSISAHETSKLLTPYVNDLDVDSTLNQLLINEQQAAAPLRYLPFAWLVYQQHQKLESRLRDVMTYQYVNARSVSDHYLSSFVQAKPYQQRRMVLDLARTLRRNQQALKPMSLANFSHWRTPPELLTVKTSEKTSAFQQSALERALLRSSQGLALIAEQQRLLGVLLATPRNVDWMFSPVDDIPAVRLADYWPNVPDNILINGIYTASGAKQIEAWLALIQQVSGQQNQLPFVTRVRERMPDIRQQNWLKLILKLPTLPRKRLDEKQWDLLQIDINQDLSPALRLFHTVQQEFSQLSPEQMRPWLQELNKIVRLGKLATHSAEFGSLLAQWDHSGWGKVLTLLGKKPSPAIQAFKKEEFAAWNDWEKARHQALISINAARVENKGASTLLSTKDKREQEGDLQLLYTRFAALRERIERPTNDIGVQGVWSLLHADDRQIMTQVMNLAACEIQNHWQHDVLWPLEQNASRLPPVRQQQAARSYLVDFIHRHAANMLARGNWGAEPARFQFGEIALTPAFMHVVNNVLDPEELLQLPQREQTLLQDEISELQLKQTELEQERVRIEGRQLAMKVSSQPATLPTAAPLMPTGTRLELFCDDREWVMNSVNLSEQASFSWRPGHCSRVRLTVHFPGFDLQHSYLGDAAWPDFVRDFAKGEKAFSMDYFGEKAAPLLVQGTQSVIVRYQLDNPTRVASAWREWAKNRQSLNESEDLLKDKKDNLRVPLSQKALSLRLTDLPTQIAQCD